VEKQETAAYLKRMRSAGDDHLKELERADRKVQEELLASQLDPRYQSHLGPTSQNGPNNDLVVRANSTADDGARVGARGKESLKQLLNKGNRPVMVGNDGNGGNGGDAGDDAMAASILLSGRTFVVPGEPLRTVLPPVVPNGFLNANMSLEERVEKRRIMQRRKKRRRVNGGGGAVVGAVGGWGGDGAGGVDNGGGWGGNVVGNPINGGNHQRRRRRRNSRVVDDSRVVDGAENEDDANTYGVVVRRKMDILLEREATYRRPAAMQMNWQTYLQSVYAT